MRTIRTTTSRTSGLHDAASLFTVDGGRNNTRPNTFELDGMPNLKTGGQVAFMPPPDAIQEFRVPMNAYDSSIGRQAGGAIQLAIQSGGQYRGSLYEFNQNRTYIRTYPTRWGNVRASRVNNLDLVVSKNFRYREHIRLQYRFETYNTYNHVRFPAPNPDPASASFGKVIQPSKTTLTWSKWP